MYMHTHRFPRRLIVFGDLYLSPHRSGVYLSVIRYVTGVQCYTSDGTDIFSSYLN